MGTAPSLVLYGNSIFLAGLKADLQTSTGFELVTIETRCPDARDRIGRCNPSVVIFDLTAARPDFAISLLKDLPDLLLLGLDPCSDEMMVVAGRSERALSTQDLIRVIDTLPGSTSPLPRHAALDRLRHLDSTGLALILERQPKIVLALAAIPMCAVFGLVLSLLSSNLSGLMTGAGMGDGWPALEFVTGMLLGGVLIGSFFRLCGRSARQY